MYKFIAVVLFVVVSVASFGEPIKFDPTGNNKLAGKRMSFNEAKAKLSQARIAAEMAVEATRKGDTANAAQFEKIVVNNITIVKQSLTPAQFAALQQQVNSGPATWGKKDYDLMLNSGLIVGRELGNGSDSNEPKAHATREELVTVGRRVYSATTSYANERVNAHDNSPYTHAPLVAKERKYVDEKSKWGVWAFWAVVVLVALWLLGRLIRALRRPMPVYVAPAAAPAAPGAPVAPVAPAVPAAGMVPPVAFVPFNNGVGQTVIPG